MEAPMENDYKVLTYIQHQNQHQNNATQRDISRETGVSLGTVNLLLKKMIQKGFVKIEKINAKSLRYMITPKGIKEKTQRTYNYIKYSYDHITTVSKTVSEILRSPPLQNAANLYLYGPPNEIYEITKIALQQNKNIKYSELKEHQLPTITKQDTILVWRIEEEEKLPNNPKIINILKKLS